MKPKVILIGLASSAVDYGKWPELSPEKLEAAFSKVLRECSAAGYEAEWCLTDTGETAGVQVAEALEKARPDIVLIGAGVRTDPDLLVLFEELVNRVYRHAPNARICFNTHPLDSVEALKRWS